VGVLLVGVGLLAGPAAAQQTVADEQTGSAAGGTLTLGGNSQSQTPSERYNVEPTHIDEPPGSTAFWRTQSGATPSTSTNSCSRSPLRETRQPNGPWCG
jgi:hypothetical protein